jgi:hypothetical protein
MEMKYGEMTEMATKMTLMEHGRRMVSHCRMDRTGIFSSLTMV